MIYKVLIFTRHWPGDLYRHLSVAARLHFSASDSPWGGGSQSVARRAQVSWKVRRVQGGTLHSNQTLLLCLGRLHEICPKMVVYPGIHSSCISDSPSRAPLQERASFALSALTNSTNAMRVLCCQSPSRRIFPTGPAQANYQTPGPFRGMQGVGISVQIQPCPAIGGHCMYCSKHIRENHRL